MVAVIVGMIASGVSVYCALHVLAWNLEEILWAIVKTNVIGFVVLLTTLAVERQEFTRRIGLMANLTRIWTFFWIVSFGLLFLLEPKLRELHTSQVLLLPLLLSAGLMVPLFGQAQDAVVRRIQRPGRLKNTGVI
ncbi:hypothetical protein WDW37_19905 [Bdellovibrionota bacterium FG-1]